MDYREMARLASLVDFTEFAKVVPMTAEPDPRVIPMTPAPMRQPIRWVTEPQSRAEWESRGRRPGR